MVKKLSDTRILVTGGTGFIGSHLVKELIRINARVVVPYIEINPRSLFSQEKLSKKTKVTLLNINNKEKLFDLIEKESIEYIFHLAAQTIVTKAYEDPRSTIETNVLGTVNILEAARMTPSIKGVIVASSDKAYGKTRKAYKEDFPLKGDHPYDVSKASADLIAQSYFKTYNLPIVITRFGNVYGEGDFHFDRIVPGICEAIIKKKMLEIRSNGRYIRDYIYVKDIVSGCLLLHKLDTIKGEAYNFSSGDTLSVLQLVKKAEEVLRVKIPYKILNIAKNEIPYQHLNDSKVRKLGWKSKFSLLNKLPEVLEWYKKIL